jgi:hypothetical protein
MNANELAKLLEVDSWYKLVTREEIATMLRQQQVLIENLNGRIERMIEKQSHYEAMAHAGGFEAGRELGMKQERALWELAASTQETRMNANELAEALEKYPDCYPNQWAANMLRAQQAEIEALKDGIEKLKDAYCQKDHEIKKAEQYCLDAFERGKQIGYADGMISRKAQEK